MPYRIRKDGPADKPFCVYNIETGERKGCSPTREAAERFMTALRMRAAGKSSTSPDLERLEELRDLYEKLPDRIVWIPKFLSISGGKVYGRDREPGDVDVVLRAEDVEDKFEIRLPLDSSFALKLDRLFADEEKAIHWVPSTFGPNWTSIPYYDLALLKRPEFEVEEVQEEEFATLQYKAFSSEMTAQAEASNRDDKVRPDKMIYPLKPFRGAERGKRMTLDSFFDLVSEDLYPYWSSTKRDGVRHLVFKDGEKVRIVSDDGVDNTETLSEIAGALKDAKGISSAVLDTEIELWEGDHHYPREAAAGAVHSGRMVDKLSVQVFDLLYLNENDLHLKPFGERWAALRDLKLPDPFKVIEHRKAKSLEELRKLASQDIRANGSEGVVVKPDSTPYDLSGRPTKSRWIKYHKVAPISVAVLERIQTKTPGTFNYRYGLRPGKLKPARTEDGLAVVGKSFNTAVKLEKGDVFTVETETVNETRDEKEGTTDLTFWVPNFIGPSEGPPSTMERAIRDAEARGVLQTKIITEEGRTRYLPTESAKVIKQARGDVADYPDEELDLEFVIQAHGYGESVHGDLRSEYKRGKVHHLVGYGIACLMEGALKGKGLESTEQLKGYLKDSKLWKLDWDTGTIKQREIRGGVVRRGDLRAFPKAKEIPVDWLRVEGKITKPDPGDPVPAGATRFHHGFLVIADKGPADWGAQKPYFREFFLHGDHFKGKYVFRMVGRQQARSLGWPLGEWEEMQATLRKETEEIKQADILPPGEPEERPRQPYYWVLMQPIDQTPYVLGREAREKNWLPPRGVSCLPKDLRKKVPQDLQYWNMDGKEASAARDELAKQDFVRELRGKSAHRKDKCMMCDAPPEVSVLWAEGMALAWFCEKCYKEWLKEHPLHQVCAEHRLKPDEDPTAWRHKEKEDLPGQYLIPPHGRMIWSGRKTAILKADEDVIEPGVRYYLLSGELAFGTIVCKKPLEVMRSDVSEFRDKHHVREEEIEDWWPDAKHLYMFGIDKFVKFDEPKEVELPSGVQNRVRPESIEFKEAAGGLFVGLPVAGGPVQRIGGTGHCVCPECGHRMEHERGTPCAELTCPKCGARMRGEEEKAVGTGRFQLQRHWFKHRVVIRFGPSSEHFDFRVQDEEGHYWHLVLDDNLLEIREVAGYEKPMRTGYVLNTDNERVVLMDMKIGQTVNLKPETEANPMKEEGAWLETLDAGDCQLLDSGADFRKYELKGKKMKGAWFFRREEPGSEFWLVSRSEGPKTKALRKLKEIYESAKESVLSLFAEDFELAEEGSFIRTKQQSDGRWRWVMISSTAFLDRDNPREIVSKESVQKSVERADKVGKYGPLLFWHQDGVKLKPMVKFGECDFQAQHELCLVESGLWDETPVARRAMETTQKEAHKWGGSIGFLPLDSEEGTVVRGTRVDVVWKDIQIVERSILPIEYAACQFSEIKTGADRMEQKKKDAMIALLGEELTKEILKDADEVNKGSSEAGAVFKEKAREPFADRLEELADAVAKENPVAANRLKAIVKALRASYGKEYPEPEKKEGDTDAEEKARKQKPIEELREVAEQLKGDLKTRLQTLINELEKSYGKKAKPEEEEEYEEPKKRKEVCEVCKQDPCVCEKPKKKKDQEALDLLKEIGEKIAGLESQIKELKGEASTRAALVRPTSSAAETPAETKEKAYEVPRAVQAITDKVFGRG